VISRQDLIFFILLAQPWFTGTANSTERQILQFRMQLTQEHQKQTVGTTSRDGSKRGSLKSANIRLWVQKELDKKQVVLVITIRHTHTPSSLKQYHHEEKVRKYIPI
jgi:hypothetical protein